MNKTVIPTKLQLGQVLLNHGVVTQDQIDTALERQKTVGHSKLLGIRQLLSCCRGTFWKNTLSFRCLRFMIP
ncbi:MAG: hypothetical protein ACYSPJ_05450 [Planctomycetota bacterium]|jgi:hypothetical protein